MNVKTRIVKPILTENGYSYIELWISLMIMINLFVLLTQIFYNINKMNNRIIENNVLAYETAVTRIELDLKEADRSSLIVRENSIQYSLNQQLYHYSISNYRFTLIIGNYSRIIYYIYEVKSVSFKQDNGVIRVKFTNLKDQDYETTIILSPYDE